jgi:hypothetical protein
LIRSTRSRHDYVLGRSAADANDPHRLADFWELGYVDEPGYDFDDGAVLVDPDGVLPPPISFLKVPESKTAKNRVHHDVRVPAGGAGDEALREQRIRDKAAQFVAPGEQSCRCTRSTARSITS